MRELGKKQKLFKSWSGTGHLLRECILIWRSAAVDEMGKLWITRGAGRRLMSYDVQRCLMTFG